MFTWSHLNIILLSLESGKRCFSFFLVLTGVIYFPGVHVFSEGTSAVILSLVLLYITCLFPPVQVFEIFPLSLIYSNLNMTHLDAFYFFFLLFLEFLCSVVWQLLLFQKIPVRYVLSALFCFCFSSGAPINLVFCHLILSLRQ